MTLNEFIKEIFYLENKKRKIPNIDKQIEVFCEYLPKYSISDNRNRLCAFLGQIYIESAGFTTTEECLCYSTKEILFKNFPRLFKGLTEEEKQTKANSLIKNSKAFSKAAYNYCHGRGYIQLTGEENYKKISQIIFGDDTLLKQPELLKEYKYAIMSACIFWNENKINQFADILDTENITLKVNGKAKLHLKERTEKTKEYLAILNQDSEFVIY
jgi:predicted chitinase